MQNENLKIELSPEDAETFYSALTSVQSTLRSRRKTQSAADALERLAGKIAAAQFLREKGYC